MIKSTVGLQRDSAGTWPMAFPNITTSSLYISQMLSSKLSYPGSVTQPSNANPAITRICFIPIPPWFCSAFYSSSSKLVCLHLCSSKMCLNYNFLPMTLLCIEKQNSNWHHSLREETHNTSRCSFLIQTGQRSPHNHCKCFCTESFRYSHSTSEQH